MRTIPCCEKMKEHKTCKNDEHKWNEKEGRCSMCHLNKSWFDNNV